MMLPSDAPPWQDVGVDGWVQKQSLEDCQRFQFPFPFSQLKPFIGQQS